VTVPDEVRDPGLWSRSAACIEAALALIRKHQEGHPIPTKLRVKVRREDRTTTHFDHEVQPDISLLVFRLFDALKQLPEFQALHGYILSSPVAGSVFVDAGNNPIREAGSQSHWLMNFYIVPLLTRYIGSQLTLDFDEGRAKAVYARLEDFLRSTRITYSIVAPLEHFEGPDDEVRLDATTLLRKLSEDEIQYLWDLGEFGGIVDRNQALGMGFCLATYQVAKKNAPTNFSQVNARLARLVTALRLLKSGQVGIPAVIQSPREPVFGPVYGGASSGPTPALLGPTYTLLLEDRERLIATYEALGSGAAVQEFRVALERFNYAYERKRPHDKLIDYWVALEALFLPDISQELSFRASLRIAYYVAGTPDEREEVFRKMRLSYDTRSDVVHGQRLKADVSEVASDTEEIVRRALRAVVTNPGSLDVDRLDAAIARGESPAQEGAVK
jgi:hypothetical protein